MIYDIYKRTANIVAEYDDYKISEFNADNINFVVYELKLKARKNSQIICKEDGGIYLRKFYPSGKATPIKEEHILCKPKKSSNEMVIVLIFGKPEMIIGLDEGIFVSAKGKTKTKKDIYVMTEEEFKSFDSDK